MSWKAKNFYAEDVLKTPARHVLKTSSRRLEDQQMFAGMFDRLELKNICENPFMHIYANTNVMQGLINIGKPCVLFLNKTIFRFFKPVCTRGSLMTQFTNLDMEKNLQYIFTSNEMLVIHT